MPDQFNSFQPAEGFTPTMSPQMQNTEVGASLLQAPEFIMPTQSAFNPEGNNGMVQTMEEKTGSFDLQQQEQPGQSDEFF